MDPGSMPGGTLGPQDCVLNETPGFVTLGTRHIVGSDWEGLDRFLSQRQGAGAPHPVRLEMGVGELVLSQDGFPILVHHPSEDRGPNSRSQNLGAFPHSPTTLAKKNRLTQFQSP